jgi:putative aldouronate transport system permease protein
MAVIALYLAVGYWNAYFNAMIFITDRTKFPLQIYLREILLTAKTAEATPSAGQDAETIAMLEKLVEVVKYGVIVISTLPIICMYPFLQKYFIKGVMIGAIKG